MIEEMLTFFLVMGRVRDRGRSRGTFKQIAGMAIGLTITFDILMAAV